MQISGTYEFRAPAALVGTSLQDEHVLGAAIPGCTSIVRADGRGTFAVTADIGIGEMRGEHAAILTFHPSETSGLDVTVAGTGKSRVEATATVTLSENGSTTQLHYEATMTAHGAVARLGGRQIEGAARLLVGQMLRALKTEIEARVS